MRVCYCIVFLFALCFTEVAAQISIPNSNPVTEGFSIGTSATASLPANWKMSGAGLGATANWADASNVTTTSQAASSGTPTAGGRYNWAPQFSTSDRAVGFMTDGAYASPNSIMAYYRNTSGATIASLNISFSIERYRTNTNTFSLAFFYSTDGTNWTAQTAGDIASNVFSTGNSSYSFFNQTTNSRSLTINNANIPNNGDFYLRWVFTNTNSTNSQGMGLDNVSVAAAAEPSPNPNLPISCPYDFIFVLDESGSIVGSGGGGATDISATLRTAAKDLIGALNNTGTRVAIVEFSSNAARGNVGGTTAYQVVDNTYIANFNSYMGPDANGTSNANNYDPEDGGGTTNWEAALNLVNTINTNDGIADLVIFLTDGNPTAYTNAQGGTTSSTTDPVVIAQALAEATVAANNVKAQGSHMFVVAIPNPSVLETNVQQISGPDRYPDIDSNFVSGDYSISSSETLRDDLQRIAQSVCKVDLNLAKASVQSACSGDTITFTLVLTNNGLDNDTNIVVTDVIPDGYTYVSDNGGAATTLNGNTLTWNIPTLGGGGISTSLQITVVMNPAGNYTNTATAVGTQQDIDSTNNDASFTVNLALNCDDGDPCTVDFCQDGSCVHVNTCCLTNAECADADLCTIDTCTNGACVNTVIICNDQNECTNDLCGDFGCEYLPRIDSLLISCPGNIVVNSAPDQCQAVVNYSPPIGVSVCQTPCLDTWVRRGGGTGTDFGRGIDLDALGNVYATGAITGTATFGTTTLVGSGLDIYVVKYDNQGNFKWAKRAGGSGDGTTPGTSGDYPDGLATDSDGNAYIVGWFDGNVSFDAFSLTSGAQSDLFIAKYDSSGNVVWAINGGGDGLDRAVSIDIQGDDIYVTGYFEGAATIGGVALSSAGDADIFVAKFKTSGTPVWVKQFRGLAKDEGDGISVKGGKLYLTGMYSGTTYFEVDTLTGFSGRDIFIAQLDTSGGVDWVRNAGAAGDEQAIMAIADNSGNVYATGNAFTSNTFGLPFSSAGSADIFLAKYNNSGTLLWLKGLGSTGFDYGTDLEFSSTGKIILSATYAGSITIGATTISNPGGNSVLIAKYDENGNFITARSGGGTGSDIPFRMAVKDGIVYSVGRFGTTGTFGQNQVISVGAEDAYVWKLCETELTTELISGLGSGSQFPEGVTTETYVVYNDEGNSDTCSFTVTVVGDSCDDQDPCTIDNCDDGECVHEAIVCDDQNLCTTDSCVNGICVFEPVVCDDENSCTRDTCDDGECIFTDIICNDQSLCTTDACVEGQCVFTPITCNDQNACTTDDCNPQTGCTTTPVVCNDGDPCTTDDCNAQTGCVATPIVCNDQNACTNDSCVNGQCVFTDVVCDDQNLCTTDTCIQGQCVFTNVVCDDQNLCTTDTCDDGECIFTDIICNDQSLCTTDACDDGECVFTPISCNDQDACTADDCNPASGCTNTLISCDDRNACTTDACDSQIGCVYTTVNCDDQNACTNDICDIATGCVYLSVTCNDQNACTSDACNPQTGCVFTPITCNDQNACTTDGCDVQTGCVTTPVSCEDQNACTIDNCNPSTGCVYTTVTCNDQNACTSDRCDEQTGCVFTTINCDDANACTSDACLTAIGCINSTIICNDGSACTTDACDVQTGCVFAEITCVDGDACTTDGCDAATGCTFTPVNCNDNNACTTETCDSQTGCVYLTVECNDNNACTNDICIQQLGCRHIVINCDDQDACTTDGCNTVRGCVHGVVNCNDQNACTTDGCSPSTGCFTTAVDCNDNNPCTQDTCGTQQGCFYFPTDCNDNDPCTVDACDIQTGCTNTPMNCADTDLCTTDKCIDGTCAHIPVLCDDSDPCTNDECVAGVCQFVALVCNDNDLCTDDFCRNGNCVFEPVSCDDQNPCTEDFCVNDVCQHLPIQGCCLNNQECDDQNDCTSDLCNGFRCYHVEPCCNDDNPCTYDFCLRGICVTTGIFCDDGDLCTQNLCEDGICSYPQINCSDNDACTIDSCVGDGICIHTPVNCNDGNACTTDFCDQSGGCQYVPVICDDLNFCTTDTCIQGQCLNTPITCVDGDLCTEDYCVEGECVFLPVECNDNDVCTFDICTDGQCTHPAISCDDNDFCTIDACGPNGCFYTPVVCNDNDLCTVDRCINGACDYTPQECSDGNLCTYDICIDGICSYPPVVCDDGIACTQDICVNGQCTATPGQINVTIEKTDMSCGCVNPNQLCLLNFAGLPSGTILAEQYAAYGIHISAQANFPGKNFAIIFDSHASGTPDPDLEVDYGNLMIIARDVVDTNPANGLVDKPNDNATGGTITLLFDYPRTIESFDFIDEEEPGTFVFAYDAFDNLIAFAPVPAAGDASIQTVPFAASGVRKLVFSIDGSGAITNIVFGDCCCDGAALATASGGTEPYTFEWSNGIFGNSIEELCPDEYCVTVTDANGCFAVSCIDIVQGGTGCDDGDSCTVDECVNSACVNTPIPNCHVTEPCTSEITGYTLVYESTIGEISPLVDGQVIDRDEFCRFNIRADFCGDQIESVKFILNGNTFRVENDVPYALAGDNPTWDYHAWIPNPGSYTLTAIPYSQDFAQGAEGTSLTINFTVIDNTPNDNENCVNPPMVDCNGDVNGTAFIDACGFCVWGNTGIPPNSLCPCDEEVQIVVSELPVLCQGNELLLKADAPGAASYLWSTGETAMEIIGQPDGVYSVTATNAFGCEAVDTQTTPPASSLLSAYVMLAENAIVLDKNKVFLGGAGARAATGSITLDDNTQVTTPNTFVRAANIFVNGGSVVTSQFNAPANIPLPAFESNVAVGGADVAVPANSVLTLNNAVYETIRIDSGSTVTFTHAEIDIDSIVTGKNVTIRFEFACVKLRLRGAFLLGENNDFNADTTAEVKIFAEGNALIGGRTKLIADIYTLSDLQTLAGGSTDYTTMIGFYIANTITGGEYTAWHWNPTCGCSGSGGPRGDEKRGEAQQRVVTQHEDKAQVRSYPNPFSEKLNVEFSLPVDSKARLDIFSSNGKKIATLFDGQVKAAELRKVEYNPAVAANGLVLYRLQTDKGVYYGKAVMVK